VAKKKLNVDDLEELIERIGADKPAEEQVAILKNTIKEMLEHGWVDDQLKDNLMSIIAKNHKIPYKCAFEE
jgi:N-acetylglucosamine kinase-like BadF-type ATPase